MTTKSAWMDLMACEWARGARAVLDAEWLDWRDWESESIFTREGDRIRLVLLCAKNPGHGALTRLVDGIERAGLLPVMVEPSERLAAWCRKRHWKARMVGRGRDRHIIFHPRREATP